MMVGHLATSLPKAIPTIITPHYTRLINHTLRTHNPRQQSYNQLITLKRTTNVSKKATKLPRVLCANMRSLTKAKHAELVQMSPDYDIIMISESWLKAHKKKTFTIPEFTLYSVERSQKRAGGVCIYARNKLATTVVHEYTSDTVSTLWLAHHQNNQPTIVYASAYHPPNLRKALCDSTIDHIIGTVSQLSSKYPHSKFVIYGDFNDLDTSHITNILPLEQIVTFPTREQNTLDLVFTNIEHYTTKPTDMCVKAPPIGSSDHCSIIRAEV